ncbi:5'-nucleotidase [Aquipluma nitroreducens]|uniref:5'-nucleotidase n=2 Tax=Aquipluma nitroreducens TaxID=2010828 RepID=A0A5K7S5G3_9BACT|nr:5'-nucleotidase [Aquipluma nitroreducens]
MGGFIMSNRRTFLKQTILGGGALTLGLIPKELFASGELVRLTVMHTNDMHCHLDPFPADHAEYPGKGGLVRIASMVNQCRKENPNLLLLDAGDMFQGTPYFNYFKGDLIVKVMSKMGYDAGTIGNHEFDNGMGDILSAINNANFPLISSNYDFSDTLLNGHVKTQLILEKGGVKVGIYGLGIELNGLVGTLNYGKTRYLDPLTTALKMESVLKNDHKCDLVICLSHLGLSYEHNKISDVTLAPQTKYTDLIVGGHTHSFLEKPLVLKNADGNPIVVNQAGWAALETGRIEFLFDRVSKRKHPVEIINNLS